MGQPLSVGQPTDHRCQASTSIQQSTVDSTTLVYHSAHTHFDYSTEYSTYIPCRQTWPLAGRQSTPGLELRVGTISWRVKRFSRRTKQTQEARVYSHDDPIRASCRAGRFHDGRTIGRSKCYSSGTFLGFQYLEPLERDGTVCCNGGGYLVGPMIP